MTMSWFINIALIVLCVGVLVQTARLMVLFRRFKQAELGEMVAGLEQATRAAQIVLDNLRTVLAVETRAQSAAVTAAAQKRDELGALRDELSVMIELGNSAAERIEQAAGAARTASGPVEMKAKGRRVRTARPGGGRKPVDQAAAPATVEAGA